MTKITAGIAAAIAAAAIGISVPATSLASTGDSAGGRTTAAAQQSSPAKAPKPAATTNVLYIYRLSPPAAQQLRVGDTLAVKVVSYAVSDGQSASGSVTYPADRLQLLGLDLTDTELSNVKLTTSTGVINFTTSATWTAVGISQIFTASFKILKTGDFSIGFGAGSRVLSGGWPPTATVPTTFLPWKFSAVANTAPVIAKPVVGSPSAGTGVVTGQVTATDAEKDKLTYSAPATTGKGQVSINAATGAFTYTPTEAARVAAAMPNANAAAQADSFTVTVSDGYGGSASVSVPVKVAPAPLPKLDLKANGDTGYLLERVLKQESNQIAVDIVKDNKGTYRVIAFISGTGGSTGSQHRNLAAYQGTVDDAEKKLFLDALTNGINEAKKLGTKNPEVMLVGYSQGGMDAQNIAKDNQNLNITTVVTFASPINKKYDELGPNTKVIHLEASEDRIPGILKGETPPKPDQVFTAPTGLPRPPGDDVKVASDLIALDILSRIAGWTKAWVHDIRPQYLNGEMAPPAYLTVANAFDKSTDSKYKDIKASIDKFVGDSSTVISRSTFVGGARVFWAKDKNGNEVKWLVNAGLSGIYGEGNPVFVLQPVSQYKQP